MNDVDFTEVDSNLGLKQRKKMFGEGNKAEFIAKIHTDIFNQGKILVNGVRMRIKLYKSKDQFCLMAEDDG